jgi:hypothetical protein
MRRFIAPLLFGLAVLAMASGTAEACKCGKAHCTCGSACCQQSCCGVEIQYEAHEVTMYKTVYEEVKEMKEIDAVKYVPETELRDIPCTVCKPAPPCGPAAGCCEKPACAAPCESCCQEQGIRKVPVTVFRPVPIKKPFETTRLVEKKIPYTYTCYVPKKVCCPQPACAPAGPACAK